jgi:hypothetical protein
MPDWRLDQRPHANGEKTNSNSPWIGQPVHGRILAGPSLEGAVPLHSLAQ